MPSATASVSSLSSCDLHWPALPLASGPEAALHAFLQSTYEATANLGGWDRAALELTQIPRPRPATA